MEILIALLVAVLICAAIGFVAWGAIAILSMVPIPAPFGRIIAIVIWVVAGIAIVIVLIRAIQGQPALPLVIGL